MASSNPPRLFLVAATDDGALRAREAFSTLEWNTRSMVPNLIAAIDGAGRPGELLQQILDVADAIREAGRHVPQDQVQAEMEAVLRSLVPCWGAPPMSTAAGAGRAS